jgi:hypothetical protein
LVLKSLDPDGAQRVLDEARRVRKDTEDTDSDTDSDTEGEPDPGDDSGDEGEDPTTTGDDADEEDDDVDYDDELAQAQNRIAELEEELAGAGVSKSASQEQDVLKSLPEPVRKRLEETEARLAEAERVAKAERDTRLDAEFVAKARDLRNLTVDPTTLGRTLRTVAESAPDAYPEIARILKSANAALAEGALYKELGADSPPADSAEAQIARLAQERVSKSSSSLSLADAEAQILNTPEGAALYRRYQEERDAAIRNR